MGRPLTLLFVGALLVPAWFTSLRIRRVGLPIVLLPIVFERAVIPARLLIEILRRGEPGLLAVVERVGSVPVRMRLFERSCGLGRRVAARRPFVPARPMPGGLIAPCASGRHGVLRHPHRSTRDGCRRRPQAPEQRSQE